jgi:hypothetical protein
MNKFEKQQNFQIAKTNFILDLKEFFNSNFINSYKGYLPFIGIITYKIFTKIPMRKYLKKNSSIPINFCEKNLSIKVKPIFKKYYNPQEQEILDINDIEINLKHIPSFSYLNNRKENLKSKSLEKEEFLKIKLAGIQYLNKEGLAFLDKLLNNKSSNYNFNLKFNNIEFKDSEKDPIVHGWLILNKKFPFNFFSSNFNLNILLAQNGYAKICNINTNGVYDEKICFFMSDLLEAEKDAKLRGKGLWRNQKSHVISEYANDKRLFNRIMNKFRMGSWGKLQLRKNIDL